MTGSTHALNPRLRQLASILGSLAVHFLVLLQLFYTNSPLPEEPSETEITVTLKPLPSAKTTSQVLRSPATAIRSRPPPGSISKKFLPRWDKNYLSDLPLNHNGNGLLMPFGSGSGKLEKLAYFSLYDLIYNNVDELLIFPSVLASHKMEGIISVQTLLTKSGELDWSQFRITGGNEYFQIYIIRVLKTIFAKPLPEIYSSRLQSSQPLDMSFHFELTEADDNSLNDKKKFIMGHVLAFYKNKHHSKMQWSLGPLEGMFPLPSARLNIGWIVQKIKGDDPLAQFMLKNRL